MGPDRNKHLRNIAILILLALIVWLIPGGAEASAVIGNILSIVFVGGLLFLGFRLYMENRSSIFGLEDRQRGILYGSLALATIALVGTRRLWEEGIGGVVWMVLMGVAVWGVYSTWRAYREY
jgi:hypothetical protein